MIKIEYGDNAITEQALQDKANELNYKYKGKQITNDNLWDLLDELTKEDYNFAIEALKNNFMEVLTSEGITKLKIPFTNWGNQTTIITKEVNKDMFSLGFDYNLSVEIMDKSYRVRLSHHDNPMGTTKLFRK